MHGEYLFNVPNLHIISKQIYNNIVLYNFNLNYRPSAV